mmetsp:Transcript_3568/g.10251  ORF Transcript_3568/g.10251 Transcript_3568/m.10251 type:complete len:295 (+) Transcript_3568:1091-1975(+)
MGRDEGGWGARRARGARPRGPRGARCAAGDLGVGDGSIGPVRAVAEGAAGGRARVAERRDEDEVALKAAVHRAVAGLHGNQPKVVGRVSKLLAHLVRCIGCIAGTPVPACQGIPEGGNRKPWEGGRCEEVGPRRCRRGIRNLAGWDDCAGVGIKAERRRHLELLLRLLLEIGLLVVGALVLLLEIGALVMLLIVGLLVVGALVLVLLMREVLLWQEGREGRAGQPNHGSCGGLGRIHGARGRLQRDLFVRQEMKLCRICGVCRLICCANTVRGLGGCCWPRGRKGLWGGCRAAA